MTKITYDDHYKVEGSSVISDLYWRSYSTDGSIGELYVRLKRDGVLCGYQAPREVYRALVANAQDPDQSVGRYWNEFVKDHYEGFSTADIELRPHMNLQDVSSAEPVQVTIPANQQPNPWDGKRRYEVVVEVTRVVTETQTVYADNVDQALVQVHESLEGEKLVKDYRFISATQYFN